MARDAVIGLTVLTIVLSLAYLVQSGRDDSPPKDEAAQQSSDEITDAQSKQTLHGLIVMNGFECDDVKLAWAGGETEFGPVASVYCGPSDRDGVYPGQKYKVYPKKYLAVPDRD